MLWKLLIRVIGGSEDWSLRSLMVDIAYEARRFGSVIFQHIPKPLNGAHNLVRYNFV